MVLCLCMENICGIWLNIQMLWREPHLALVWGPCPGVGTLPLLCLGGCSTLTVPQRLDPLGERLFPKLPLGCCYHQQEIRAWQAKLADVHFGISL